MSDLKLENLAEITKNWYICKKLKIMSKNTSISLGSHFEDFLLKKTGSGRYKSVSEVVRAGLRLLEDEEKKMEVLKEALEHGENSDLIENFDSKKHLKDLHKRHL